MALSVQLQKDDDDSGNVCKWTMATHSLTGCQTGHAVFETAIA